MHKLFAWQVSKVAVREYPFGCSSIQGRRPSQEDRAVGCRSMRHAPLQCQAHVQLMCLLRPQGAWRLWALSREAAAHWTASRRSHTTLVSIRSAAPTERRETPWLGLG